MGWGLCPRHQPGCSRKVCRGVREKRRLHPLRLRKQALQALFPPQGRHPLTQHHRRPRPPGLTMKQPGSAGFCTLLLCSSPAASFPSPHKHPSRPLLYPSRTPSCTPFPGCSPPSSALKTAEISLFTGLYAIYNNVYFKKLGVVEGGAIARNRGSNRKNAYFYPLSIHPLISTFCNPFLHQV